MVWSENVWNSADIIIIYYSGKNSTLQIREFPRGKAGIFAHADC